MMIETITKEGLGTWLEKGISNIAYISLGLGLDNTASQSFIEAKVSEDYQLIYSVNYHNFRDLMYLPWKMKVKKKKRKI